MEMDMGENDEAPVCGIDGCATPREAQAAPMVAAQAGPTHQLAIISDAICPWCYVGKRRLEKALTLLPDNVRLNVSWHAFELNPQMPREGIERKLYRMKKFGSWERSLQMDAQLTEVGKQDGIDFRYEVTE